MSIALFSVWSGVFVWGCKARREVNRKRFRLNLNGYALYPSNTSHPEEYVSQIWTVRRSSLWIGLQMFELKIQARSAVEETELFYHP